MTDNLPAVRQEAPIARQDPDAWIPVVENYAALAMRIAGTAFVPKDLRGKPEATAAAMLYGREVGLPPMTALTQTHVIDGRPSMSAEAMRALILAAGHEVETLEHTSERVTMRGRRRGSETWTEVTWTYDMAREAGLIAKDNWRKYRRAMLAARCTADLARLVFPDVIHGMIAYEEAVDEGLTSLPETDAASSPPAPSTKVSRQRKARKSSAASQTLSPSAGQGPEAPKTPPGPPLPGEDGHVIPGVPSSAEATAESPEADPPASAEPSPPKTEAASPDASRTEEEDSKRAQEDAPPPPTKDLPERPGETPPAELKGRGGAHLEDHAGSRAPDPQASATPTKPEGKPINKGQTTALVASLNALGVKDREERLYVLSVLTHRGIETSKDLTSSEASAVLDTLARCEGKRERLDALLGGFTFEEPPPEEGT